MVEESGIGLDWAEFAEILIQQHSLSSDYLSECIEKLLEDDLRFLEDSFYWFYGRGAKFVDALNQQDWYRYSVLWGDARDLFEDEYQQRKLK